MARWLNVLQIAHILPEETVQSFPLPPPPVSLILFEKGLRKGAKPQQGRYGVGCILAGEGEFGAWLDRRVPADEFTHGEPVQAMRVVSSLKGIAPFSIDIQACASGDQKTNTVPVNIVFPLDPPLPLPVLVNLIQDTKMKHQDRAGNY